jgi:predicted ATPase with chaperone activity
MSSQLNATAPGEPGVSDAVSAAQPSASQVYIPPQPRSIEETGLDAGFLHDLILKVIYFHGNITGQRIEEIIKLPFLNIIDNILRFLNLEEYIDTIGADSSSLGHRSFQYIITQKGRNKVNETLERSQYAGPAPVPLNEYIDIAERQSISDMIVDKPTIRQAFNHIVISERMLDRIGPATNSARSLFLYGPPGNGKTTIADGIANLLPGNVIIPYAIEVDGQIIKVYDPLNHKIIARNEVRSPEVDPPFGQAASMSMENTPDARWLVCKRPQVVVGGELILEQLELIFDPIAKVYEAPFQMKANGGLFLIDDFGRQKCRPSDLLNRWIVPLEKRVDYLALQTGKKLQVPFDVLIVFSTNLDPTDLVDDAFLRRIRHKISVPNPSPNEFREIFKRVARSKKIPYSDEGLRYLIQEHYMKTGRDLRACHPRDLCDQVLDEAKYRGTEPEMSRELLDRACEAYFVQLSLQ